MKLTEKIAYMKGFLDALELDGSSKESKAIMRMSEVMEEMGVYIDDLQSQVDELTELCDLLDEDLGEVEYDLYCDEDDEDEEFDDDSVGYRRVFDDDDDDYTLGKVLPADYDDYALEDDEDDDDEDYDVMQYVVNCPSCDETVNLSESQLEEGSMICPHCGELLEFNYDNIETEFPEEQESEEEETENSDEGETE